VFAQTVYDEGYSWKVKIAAAGLYAAASPGTAHGWVLEHMQESSPHGILQAGLVQVLSGIPDEAVLEDLKKILDEMEV